MKNTSLLIIAILSLILWSCGGAEQSMAEESYKMDLSEDMEIEPPQTSEPPSPLLAQQTDFKKTEDPQTEEEQTDVVPDEPQVVERKLIKNGRIGFQTNDLGKTHQRVLSLSKKYKAYIATDEVIKRYDQTEHNIIVRIPAKNFDKLLANIGEGVSEFDYKEINSQDVTAEYLDLEARMKTKRELESRYLQILQKANTVTDMLEVERQLEQVRGEIESMQGRLKFLKNQVAFSTLNISFYKEVPYKGEGFFARLGKGFGEGWQGLLTFIVGLAYTWPFLIMLGFGIWFVRRLWKNWQRTK